MSESISQGNLTAAIGAVFNTIAQHTATPNAAPVEPQTLAEAQAALAKSEARYQAAISKIFDTLKSPRPKLGSAAAEPQTSMENLPADFLPKDQARGGGYVEVQPHWSR